MVRELNERNANIAMTNSAWKQISSKFLTECGIVVIEEQYRCRARTILKWDIGKFPTDEELKIALTNFVGDQRIEAYEAYWCTFADSYKLVLRDVPNH